MTTKHILISGAGIGGLTAALCLLEQGHHVTVFEQATDLKAVGAGLQLSANATRVLDGLGLESELDKVSIRPRGKCLRLWNTGQTWELFDLSEESRTRYGHAYRMLYRPDLHRILVDAFEGAAPGMLRLGAKVTDVAQDDHAVSITLSDGSVHRGDALIGADGVHSVTREKLIASDRPRFSGCIAWRGVIDIDKLPVSMQGPQGMNWIGPGAHIVHYPVHAGRLVSFTGIVEKEGWFRESWTEQGSIAECRSDFEGWHPDVQAFIDLLGPAPLRWAMMIRDPLHNWTVGRVTLLGDAAHPTLPFLAQGAGMAIEDGRVLARALDACGDDVAQGLRVYQATRIDRTTRIVNGSTANASRFHNPVLSTPEGAAAYVASEFADSTVRSRYDWLFAYEPENTPLITPSAA